MPSLGYALSSSFLVTFDLATPGTAASVVTISGITAGQTLVGIDIRPANGLLYGLGVNAATDVCTLYTISTTTGAASAVGSILGAGSGIDLPAGDYGFDFNPMVDRIRVTTASRENFRINPNNGALSGVDTDLPVGFAISGVAYSNNNAGASSTTLFALDATSDQMTIQNGNSGTQTLVGPLSLDFSAAPGFDIAPSNGGPATTSGLALLTVGGINRLYSINLATGAATLVGNFLNGITPASGFTINSSPLIVSNGGGDTAILSGPENSTVVTTVQATDAQTLSYSIAGGADQARFQINATTGALSFIARPNFESPADSDHNNSYVVQVGVSDGSLTDIQTITVNVTNLPDDTNGAHLGDFNGNGRSDILFQNFNTGGVAGWTTNGAGALSDIFSGGTLPPGFHVDGTGNFNSATGDDILLRSDSGQIAVWVTNGTSIVDFKILGSTSSGFLNSGIGDFTGDGQSDLLFRNANTGEIASWQVSDNQLGPAAPRVLGSAPSVYQIVAVADFTGDRQADILFRNSSTGEIAEWQVANNQLGPAAPHVIGSTSTSFHIVGTGDFDGNAANDILFREGGTGQLAVWLLNSSGDLLGAPQAIGSASLSLGVAGIGDLNGDGRSDIIFRDAAGGLSEWLMNGASIETAQVVGAASNDFVIAAHQFDLV